MKLPLSIFAAGIGLIATTLSSRAQPGAVDTNFNASLNSGAQAYAVAVQTNGQILIGGLFRSVGGVTRTNVARLNPNGSLDASFNGGTVADYAGSYVSAIEVQPDGKILLGGSFASSTFATPYNIARLNTNGTPDAGFDVNLYVDNAVNVVRVLTNGQIVIGGAFVYVDGLLRRSVARLNANGTLDSSFDACVAASSGAGATGLSVLSNGQLLVSGTFSFSTGTSRDGVARLNSNGDLDNTYAAPLDVDLTGSAYSLICRSNGTALLGGSFGAFHGTPGRGLVQVTTNGIPDSGFTVGSGINAGGTNFAMLLQPDGKVIIGGDFTNYNGVARSRVARINSDGSLDPLFSAGSGANDAVSAFALQSDGKILVAGKFSSVNGVSRIGIVRLKGDPKSHLDSPTRLGGGQFQFKFHGDDQIPYAIQASSNLLNWDAITNFTSGTNAVTILDTNAPSISRRFYRAAYPP